MNKDENASGSNISNPFSQTRGRGTTTAPANRFDQIEVAWDLDAFEEIRRVDPEFEPPPLKTIYFRDDSQSIISRNDSPDVGFDASLNPYRGCEHGCAYCYARPTHDYLGFNTGIDFESKIMVKPDAPALLRKELAASRWKPKVLACSGVTDCYQPIEAKLKITRGCLEVLAEARNPVVIVTKNYLVTRDIDLLSELAVHNAAMVYISLTTLDSELARKLEPRASSPKMRLRAISKLRAAGVRVGVSTAPMIPGLNDHELPALLSAAAEAGAETAFYTAVRLPWGVAEVFSDWLEQHVPGQKEKVLGRIREMRGGKLNDSSFGDRMRGSGIVAEELKSLFRVSARRAGLDKAPAPLSTAAFRRPALDGQMTLL
ncbi:MAG: PA0069 family radical SAM protein [Verrucomicrobia bacterium]|nr:PA0069 family radical SAM protein [Verrucomicrobiota bacterium]